MMGADVHLRVTGENRQGAAGRLFLCASLAVCLIAGGMVAIAGPEASARVSIVPQDMAAWHQHLHPVQADAQPKLTVNDASGPVGAPVRLDITVNHDETGGYAFLMFRGLPEGFDFSSGFRVKNSWVVSLRDVADLQIAPPAEFRGQIQLTVILVRGRNDAVETQSIRISFGAEPPESPEPQISAAPEQEAPAPDNGTSDQVLTAAVPSPAPEEEEDFAAGIGVNELDFQIPQQMQVTKESETRLLERAAQLVEIGEITSARLMFEHLAKQGSGLGALALAQTYDPVYFRAMRTMGGPTADLDKARLWYGIAAELGQEEAKDRLGAIAGN